jgi:hypothetical protein
MLNLPTIYLKPKIKIKNFEIRKSKIIRKNISAWKGSKITKLDE